jgi:hypothetical protein
LKIEKKKWKGEKWRNVFTRNDVDLKFLPHERIRAAAGGITKCNHNQCCEKNE